MKRIAIFQDNFDVGGIQKSLCNLLHMFDYENYTVDLYLSEKKSFWELDFPEQLNVKYLKKLPRICSFLPFDIARKLVKLDFSGVEEYDLAIDFNSYQFSCALGALSVPAKRRVMWIHNNVGIKLKNEWKYRVLWYNFKDKFKYYDQFVAVSAALVQPFKESSGIYEKKYNVIQNTINVDEIYTKATEETDFTVDENKLNFVALGRLCHQKAYDIMLQDFYEACEKRDDLHLYIIGDGEKRFSLEYQRDSLGLTDKVTFLGQQPNPFKFMEKMDCFISTSRYEGQPVNIMEAKAVGLPLYCTKNLEQYTEGLVGYEDIVSAICSAQRCEKHRDSLEEYNSQILNSIKALAETDINEEVRKTVHIIALHLGVGGVEKAICSMANLFLDKYDVEIRSVYEMPGSPAFPLDERIHVKYLLDDVPNRAEWKQAIKGLHPISFIKESYRSFMILANKKLAVIKTIHSIKDGIIITTRHEDNIELSRFGAKNVFKIAQMHHDHRFDKKYVSGMKHKYGNIDVLALLTPQLVDEVREMMRGRNRHTELVYMPNFLEHFPENTDGPREKTVVAVGRLSAVKRFDLLAKEFVNIHEKAPDWKLRIIGDGEDKALIEQIIADNNAEDYIILPGRKNGEEVEEEMCKASIYAMTSESEGFPFVLLEAQSCALPIIAYDVRVGPGVFVHSGEDGYLIPEGNNAEFEEKLLEMMNNAEMRATMGKKALEGVQEFSRDRVAEKWYSVIKS